MTARQSTRSGRTRSTNDGRSSVRQPRAGDGSARSSTRGRIRRSPSARSCAVEVVHDEVIAVDGDGEGRACVDGHAGEPAVVGAEVEHHGRVERGGRARHERLLGLEVAVGVVGSGAVARPRGCRGLPLEALDGSLEVGHLGVDDLGPEPRLLQLPPDVVAGAGVVVGVAGLGAGVEAHVGEQVAPEALPSLEGVGRMGGGDPVQRAPEPGLERDVGDRLQVEGVEEQLAELAVARPRLTGHQSLERPEVDEHRPRAVELDVVRRGVLRQHALGEGRPAEVELQEGRVPQHREGPLVGVGQHPERARGAGRPPTCRRWGRRRPGRSWWPPAGRRPARRGRPAWPRRPRSRPGRRR